MFYKIVKRIADFLVSLLLILLLFPILFFVVILIKLDSSGPIFFTQQRLGYKGRVFKVLKFRTMTNKKRDVHSEVLKGNAEVTKVGSILRRFKIDELPQLLNIVLGDMSIVGPRPCLVGQKDEFNEDGILRLNVRPGATGLAQVNGNIFLSWPERWSYDAHYVKNQSLKLDLRILAKTFRVIFQGEEKFTNKML